VPVIAIGAVDLVAFVLGLGALLALFAMYVPVKILGLLLKGVPVIGGALNNTLAAGLQSAMKTVAGQLDAWAAVVNNLLASIGGGLWWLFHKMLAVVTHLSFVIQAVEGHAQHAQSTADNAQATANGAAQALPFESELNQVVQSQANAAANLANLSAAQATLAQTLATQDESQAQTRTADQAANASALQSVANTLGNDISSVKSDVQSVANTVFGTVEPAITAIQDTVSNLSIPNLGSIEDVITSDINIALTVAGVAAIPGILSTVETLTTEVAECVEPLCDTVTPNARSLGNLGKFLGELETLGFAALMVALAAEVLTDPQAVADDISSVVTDIGSGPLAAFRDVVGV
jgi:hypothetical protein